MSVREFESAKDAEARIRGFLASLVRDVEPLDATANSVRASAERHVPRTLPIRKYALSFAAVSALSIAAGFFVEGQIAPSTEGKKPTIYGDMYGRQGSATPAPGTCTEQTSSINGVANGLTSETYDTERAALDAQAMLSIPTTPANAAAGWKTAQPHVYEKEGWRVTVGQTADGRWRAIGLRHCF